MLFQLKGDYFDGKFHLPKEANQKLSIEKYSPADLNQKLWECTVSHGHIEPVVESSVKGFKTWRSKSIEERSQFLKNYQEQILASKEEIAKAISLETGKPLWEASTEVQSCINKVDITLKDSLAKIQTQSFQDIMPKTTGRIVYKPIGPTFVIGPFNFPCHLPNGQILSALLAGNSIIFKPSEKTILSAQLLIECFDRAKFPNGVVNLINGRGEAARRILKEKAIKGVHFTGSHEVGQKILEATYKDTSKLVALEMGGKNCCIVHDDANLDLTLLELVKAAFLTSGQRCVATSKVAIHSKIKDQFIDKFHDMAKKLIIDHPIDFEDEPFMGPLIDKHSTDNYLNYIGMAKREGFDEVMRGKVLQKKYEGHYVSPSIHYKDSVDGKSVFFNSEIFGPNVCFVPYNDIEQAIEMANMGPYGLAAGIFTKDKSLYEKAVQELDVGILNWNRSTAGASSRLPFGGVKRSGNYHPAAVTTIDSCVYPVSSLEIDPNEKADFSSLKGLKS